MYAARGPARAVKSRETVVTVTEGFVTRTYAVTGTVTFFEQVM